MTEPRFWHDNRFGRERRGYPVVGVSWYEAMAYATWLTEVLRRAKGGDPDLPSEDQALVADLLEAGVTEVCLPTEGEWEQMAGGVAEGNRYPWDPLPGPATRDKAAILARANTRESEIRSTTPVAMYPMGASQPFELMDLAGNVWEWTNSWYSKEREYRVLRGGSWGLDQGSARCSPRYDRYPDLSYSNVGFRPVSPVF